MGHSLLFRKITRNGSVDQHSEREMTDEEKLRLLQDMDEEEEGDYNY